MAELVIKLDDETYKEVMERTEFDTLSLGVKLIEAVQNGIQLPKGHGDLIDKEYLKENINGWYAFMKDICKQPYMTLKQEEIIGKINIMTPIIETDKKYETKAITRGNCMMCGKELTEGLFFCKECETKQIAELKGATKSEQTDIKFNHEGFYEFLLNTINPNEMEKYRSMFLSSEEIVN